MPEPDSFAGTGFLWLDCAACRQLTGFWVGDEEGLAVFYQRRRCCDRCVMGVKVDSETQRVFVDGREVHLQPREYALLTFLLKHPGVPMHVERLIAGVWADSWDSVQTQTVYAFIHRLRNKLGPQYIQTRWSKGYFIDP